MKVLSLNCQKGHQPGNAGFLQQLKMESLYDFILLQEVSADMSNDLLANPFSYKVLVPFNEVTGTFAQTVILYHPRFRLEKFLFFPTGQFTHKTPRREYGMTLVKFTDPELAKPLWVGSLHTHSGPRFWIRKKEVVYFKEQLLREWKAGEMAVLAGDFNSGYPWEHRVNCSLLAPEFVEITEGIRNTCDSMYLERSNSRTTALSYLGKIGINFRLATDHAFTDRQSTRTLQFSWQLMDMKERVSDHLPLKIEIRL